ncbi:hypothetical protein BX600DRAFT_478032 [Xylariales sp. PMI_506]|nr:hypothetical protein BX600DRAFT_478032 [Xylariales sp. PMI_506]
MDDDLAEPSKKRLRTSHACDVCRSRKIRCDGKQPCQACNVSKQECSYGSEANTRGKSDLILEGVMRVEKLLQQMNTSIVLLSPSPAVHTPQSAAPPLSQRSLSTDDVSPGHHQQSNLENAILDSLHTSTTESILAWSYFDAFPSIRQNYVSIFQLEQSRPRLQMRSSLMYPYLSGAELETILNSFQDAVNFWYPTLSLTQLDHVRLLVSHGLHEGTDDPVAACCAQLVMALGCASEVVHGLVQNEDVVPTQEDIRAKNARRAMGELYFDGAMRSLHAVHAEMSCAAVQSLFFTALYYAYLRRPLQAWNCIHDTATKCLLLLSYPPENEPGESQECLRRIFWACYILESDYLAELSALPQSGIARIESSVPLPGTYTTHADPDATEHASLYFLACISMRRLLNRVHQLLYARDSGAAADIARFPAIVTELDHQLDEWRSVLPGAFRFSLDGDSDQPDGGLDAAGSTAEDQQQMLPSEYSGFLRQRYLTCRSVIYRPYLAWLLANGPRGGGLEASEIVVRAKVCLDACTAHILGLTGFSHTVLVDTWICVLSMAAAMLLLLATCHSMGQVTRVRRDVMLTGPHLRKVFGQWQAVLGTPESPSVEQGMRIIYETERLMHRGLGGGGPRPGSTHSAPNSAAAAAAAAAVLAAGSTGLDTAAITDEEVDVAASMCAMTRE